MRNRKSKASHVAVHEAEHQLFLSRSVVLEEFCWNPDCLRVRNPHPLTLAGEEHTDEKRGFVVQQKV